MDNLQFFHIPLRNAVSLKPPTDYFEKSELKTGQIISSSFCVLNISYRQNVCLEQYRVSSTIGG